MKAIKLYKNKDKNFTVYRIYEDMKCFHDMLSEIIHIDEVGTEIKLVIVEITEEEYKTLSKFGRLGNE